MKVRYVCAGMYDLIIVGGVLKVESVPYMTEIIAKDKRFFY